MFIPRKLLFVLSVCITCHASAQQTIIKYLSGTDKDHTVNWDFFCTKGAMSGSWTKIPVPSNWELQGFGGYNYGHEKNKHDEQGLYRYRFMADKNWAGKQIELVFAGVMTDVEVKLNGQPVGPIHQGGFYEFLYNISPLIKPGAENLLEATVSKMSADSSVNRAEREGDFWVFGGIFRPVYLKVLPATFIERVAIDAKADGKFNMDVFAENLQAGDKMVAQVTTLSGEKFGTAFNTIITNNTAPVSLSQTFDHPKTWNPELPALYKVEVSIQRGRKIIHSYQQRFGFRTVEVRKGDGIYVNNVKVILKGVDRHSAWPESGRTLSRPIHLMDIGLIKDMNMNAVRMSHYPPDTEFLDLCDSLGLFVLDELTGWQKKYATPIGKKLVKELVVRDVNHPSILFWDNGNEGGWNTDLDNDYALYDIQKRTVLHPWNNFNNVDTKHYPDYSYIEKAAEKNDILLHTEMIHGLYDGGHGAGLEDYWNLMRSNPRHAGGFLWVLADEGVVRKDHHDSIDTYGNNAPDGIVGPHREKEGSYYTIKEIWSPVQVNKPVLDAKFNGSLAIENNYLYTNLSVCRFRWQLIRYAAVKENKTGHTVIASGSSTTELAPGAKGNISLHLPANCQKADALQFSAYDRNGHLLYTWTWPVKNTAEMVSPLISLSNKNRQTEELINGNIYAVTADGIRYNFDIEKGVLLSVVKKNTVLPFSNGPVHANGAETLQSFSHRREKNASIIEAAFGGRNTLQIKWTIAPGSPVQLDYRYTQKDSADFYGISFDLNESDIKGMKWLGDGPYRVWKNRLKGTTLDVWHKKYNTTVTGETFDYPEFAGYHANLHWAVIETTKGPFTVYTTNPGIYLQLLHPGKQKTKFNPFVNPPFPKANLGFLHAIAPIGTKFKAAETMGPQSQRNAAPDGVIKASVWFDFR